MAFGWDFNKGGLSKNDGTSMRGLSRSDGTSVKSLTRNGDFNDEPSKLGYQICSVLTTVLYYLDCSFLFFHPRPKSHFPKTTFIYYLLLG
jgi:hypothetical protein